MGKTLKYVSEFSFPSDKGYSGSAGKQMVKGYARGGSCGPMKKADGGAVMGASAPQQQPYQQSMGQQPQAQQPSVGAFGFSGFGAAPQQQGGFPAAQEKPMSQQIPGVAPQYKKGGTVKSSKGLAGTRKPMKKADGGRVDDPRRPMIDRTIPELIDAINRERAMEMADRMAAERVMELVRPSRRISQGLRSPRAEMARERAIMGEDAGYKKGGMAMRKQYPTNNGKPMISGPKAAPAPKADMLYSKKEVGAKNLLRDGKAPALPHAKGSVNMKSGGPVKKAMGGAMPTQTAMRQAAQQQKMTQPGMGLAAQQQPMPPGVSAGAARPGQPQQPLSQQALQMLQGKSPPPGQPQRQMPPLRGPQGQMPPPGQQRTQGPMQKTMGNVQAPPEGSEAYRSYQKVIPPQYRQLIESGKMTQQQMSKIMQSPMMQKRMQYESKYTGPMGPQSPQMQQLRKELGSAPNTQGLPPRPTGGLGQGLLRPENTTPNLAQRPAGNTGGFANAMSSLFGNTSPVASPGKPGSAMGATPNIGGVPGAVMKKGGVVKKAMGGAMPSGQMKQLPPSRGGNQSAVPARPAPKVETAPNVRPMPSPNPRRVPQVEVNPNARPMPSPNPRQRGQIDTRTTPPQMATYKKGGQAKVGKVMSEFKAGELHSGSKSGPVVKSRKQAIAIGLSEARKAKK